MGNVDDPDRNFAQLLQYELDSEYVRYEQTHKKSSTNAYPDDYLNSSKGIIDPNWELVDPTPNIVNLFLAFSEKYFWGRLATVTVVWSKRMMACAGICSYEGRGGLCKIALSEPLLKLRPRKDLVETLLHEMIHAYLFVTDNNRDRDGHGVEFHKHMDRINTSAGTRISVYHSFHDEVRLYQQHWWRCDGPCQKRHPFYGMVRRSQNRAPGPNDRWFADHKRTCGGTFVKVKEPEKKQTAKEKATSKAKYNLGDIRKYLNTSGSPSQAGPSTSKTLTSNGVNFIHGFHDLNLTGRPVFPPKSLNNNNNTTRNANTNIVGFKDFKKPGYGSTGLKSNSSSTVVVTNKNYKPTKTDELSTISNTMPKTFVAAKNNNSSNNYEIVRNHWLNRFQCMSPSPKRLSNEDSTGTLAKKPKTDQSSNIIACPICWNQFPETEINDHIDKCLTSSQRADISPKQIKSEFSVCPICQKSVLNSILEQHVNSCIENAYLDDSVQEVALKKCEVCTKYFPPKEYDSHVKKCIVIELLDDSFDEEFEYVKCNCGKAMDSDEYKVHKTSCCQATNYAEETNHCQVCKTDIDATIYADHLAKCFDKMLESVPSTSRATERVDVEMLPCLICNKSIVKSDLEEHLETCLDGTVGNITAFDDDFNEEGNSSGENVRNVSMFNCPVCLKLIKDEEMNLHLDECLKN